VQLDSGYHCSQSSSSMGGIQATFSTSFTLSNVTALAPAGNTVLTWSGSQGILFSSSGNPTFLEMFAPSVYGYAAQWTGVGSWQYLPNATVNYQAYALDAIARPGHQLTTGNIFHIIIRDSKNNVLFDSNPKSTLISNTQSSVASGTITVLNPPPTDVSALLQEQVDSQKSALIGVSVTAGILGVALIVAIALVIYLIRDKSMFQATMKTTVIPKLGKP